jgi:hypothetical protein
MAFPDFNHGLPSVLWERLDRIDRRLRVIGRIVILIETIGVWFGATAGLSEMGLGKGYAALIGLAAGLTIGALSQRDFDR